MDPSLQATYYRTALLLGLIRGEVVHEWAERVIANDPKPPSAFIDIISVPIDDLSEMRHALWPLVIDPPPLEVLQAVLGSIRQELWSGRRQLADALMILRQMRSMLKLPPDLYADLNAALVAHASDPQAQSIAHWLQRFA